MFSVLAGVRHSTSPRERLHTVKELIQRLLDTILSKRSTFSLYCPLENAIIHRLEYDRLCLYNSAPLPSLVHRLRYQLELWIIFLMTRSGEVSFRVACMKVNGDLSAPIKNLPNDLLTEFFAKCSYDSSANGKVLCVSSFVW